MIFKNMMYLLAFVIFFGSCRKIDNYAEPNGDIYGILTDNITKDTLQSEQPNGFNIKLYEVGWRMNSPIIISGKPDGTFEDAWLFQDKYKVIPTEGAFFPVTDTALINIGKHTEVNFTVTPFLALTGVSVQPGSGKITTSYKITRSQFSNKIVERETLVSKIPTINDAIFDFKANSDLTNIPDADILSTQYTDVVTGLTVGSTYYVRVAVRTDNPLKRYNYSKIFKVVIH